MKPRTSSLDKFFLYSAIVFASVPAVVLTVIIASLVI